MKILFEGVKRAPCWESLQTCVREMLKDDVGRFVRIDKECGGDYHGTGNYTVDFRTANYDIVQIEVVVNG